MKVLSSLASMEQLRQRELVFLYIPERFWWGQMSCRARMPREKRSEVCSSKVDSVSKKVQSFCGEGKPCTLLAFRSPTSSFISNGSLSFTSPSTKTVPRLTAPYSSRISRISLSPPATLAMMYSTSSLEKVQFLTLRRVRYSSRGVAVLKMSSRAGRLLQGAKPLFLQKLWSGRRWGEALAARSLILPSNPCSSSSELGRRVRTSQRSFDCLWTALLTAPVPSTSSNSSRQFEGQLLPILCI